MFSQIKEFFTHKQQKTRSNRWIFATMLVGAVISLIGAFVLSIDAVELAKNPGADLICSINVIVNCVTVAAHPTAEMFGFPNSFIGLITAPVVMTVAVAGLMGVVFPKLFMFAAQIGYTLGLLFAYYMLYLSMFVIEALCPWCMVVMLATTFIFFSLTRYNIREENLYLPKKISKKLKHFIDKDYDKLLLATIVMLLVVGILLKYGNSLFA